MQKIKDILGSPRFWALVIGLAFVFLKAFMPTLPLDETQVATAVTALVVFIVSVSVAGSPTVWMELLKSGKFWLLVTSLVFIFIRALWPAFPLTEEQVIAIIVALSGVSVGMSYRPVNTSR
jgi:hypothetical protein